MSSPSIEMDLKDLQAISVLGRGGKGVVFLVRAGPKSLALKTVSKSDDNRRIWFERDVLQSLRHPLLPSLHGVVATDKIIAFAIDLCSGGDLAALRCRQTENMFSDDAIRFYAAELVLAIRHLHEMGIVYRDLKPENVLIQSTGHIMLVDFDLSTKLKLKSSPPESEFLHNVPILKARKKKKKKGCFLVCNSGVSPEEAPPPPPPPAASTPSTRNGRSNSFVGTEEYVAPEIIKGDGHGAAVDWWGLGVVLYEMLYGRTPFRGLNRKETFFRILTKNPELVGEQTPLRDLIGRLLNKDPSMRINGEEVKEHEFFRGVDWEQLMEISRPPYIPAGAEWEEEEGDEGRTVIDVEKVVEEVLFRKGHKEDDGLTSPAKTGEFSVF